MIFTRLNEQSTIVHTQLHKMEHTMMNQNVSLDEMDNVDGSFMKSDRTRFVFDLFDLLN